VFVSGIGSTTTYPDYKPAPFIVASRHEGVDMVTVVTEGIFSYCSFKVKIDTDRYLGPEQATVRHRGEAVGHVSTIEYGSQFLALGGVHHLTGGSKKEGRVACEMMMALGNREPVELQIEGGAAVVVAADKPPIVDGVEEQRMRVGCGSATIGIFAPQWFGHADEVVVSTTTSPACSPSTRPASSSTWRLRGIAVRGRKSTPGRYFQVANPGSGWGGTDISTRSPSSKGWDGGTGAAGPAHADGLDHRRGRRLVRPRRRRSCRGRRDAAEVRRVVERIGENCEPSLCSVLYVAGAGGSLRAGVTDNPVRLTRSIKSLLVNVTCGGAPVYVWPGGGITVMVDVAKMPAASFGSVPTPAIVSPIEFTMRLDDYRALGGHMDRVQRLEQVLSPARGAPSRRAPATPGRSIACAGRAHERRRRAPARRRPLALPARADRLHRLRRRRERRRRRVRRSRLAALFAASSTSSSPKLPLLRARPVVARGCRGPRRAADGAAHGRGLPGARDRGLFLTAMAAVAAASPRS
jgi:hypothetical protein